MKTFIIFAISIYFFIGCCKEDSIDSKSQNFGTATINGSKVNLTPFISRSINMSDKYFIILENELINGIGGNIQFSWIDRNLKSQILTNSPHESKILFSKYYARLGDGDVAGNRYIINENDSIVDYLQITSIDEQTGIWKGIFEATFIRDEDKRVNYITPDTIVIKDGYFEVKLE